MLLLLTGCLVPWQEDWAPPRGNDRPPLETADTGDTADSDTDEPCLIEVTQSIAADETWSKGCTYTLKDVIYVDAPASLGIQPGTRIEADPGAALVIASGAELRAEGSSSEPIVFTSSSETPAAGDWGGLVVLGGAPGNGVGQVPGTPVKETRLSFGGAEPTGSCGALTFVRVEFAGGTAVNTTLPGLTLGACGAQTTVHNVQVHQSGASGVALLGGTVDIQKMLVTGPGTSGFEWAQGWTGRAQWLAVQLDEDRGNQALKGSNSRQDHDATPRSLPSLYNVTLVSSSDATARQTGLVLGEGTGAHFGNLILSGWSMAALDLRDEIQDRADAGELDFAAVLMNDCGPTGTIFYEKEDEGTEQDDDFGLDERDFMLAMPGVLAADPELSDPGNRDAPGLTPAADGAASKGAATPPDDGFFDISATWIGAVEPGATSTWFDGWSSFP